MSETATEDVAATETPAPEQQPEATKPTETVEFWKQKAREQESRAKSNAKAAEQLAALEESQKTEQQKIADRAIAAERERDEARADKLRYRAAAKHGIGEDDFDLIGSGDEDAISARAERLGVLLKAEAENATLRAEIEALKAGKPTPGASRPTASLKPGATAEQADEASGFSSYYDEHGRPRF